MSTAKFTVSKRSNIAFGDTFDEAAVLASLKDEDFWDNPDLTKEVELAVAYNVQSRRPECESATKSIVVLDNLPQAPLSKMPRLETVVRSLLQSKKISIISASFPVSQERGRGLCLILLDSETEARKLCNLLDNHHFDSNYILRAYTLDDRESLLKKVQKPSQNDQKTEDLSKRDSQEEDPQLKKIPFADLPNINSHLLNFEEYLAMCANNGSITILSVNPKSIVGVYKNFSLSKVQWSPKGTFLVGFNEKGLVLASGSFNKANSYSGKRNFIFFIC